MLAGLLLSGESAPVATPQLGGATLGLIITTGVLGIVGGSLALAAGVRQRQLQAASQSGTGNQSGTRYPAQTGNPPGTG
jgi:hypothetical protein